MLKGLKQYYNQLDSEQREQFCKEIGVQKRYVEYNLLGDAPRHLRRVPSCSLVERIYMACKGEVSVAGILADFYPRVKGEVEQLLYDRVRDLLGGEAKQVGRDQSATALPLATADQSSPKGDRDITASVVSADQSTHEV